MDKKNILIITAHPDDNLYAAGTLKLLSEQGFELREVLMSMGENGSVIQNGKQTKLVPEETARIRKDEYTKAASLLNIKGTYFMNEKDGAFVENIQERNKVVWELVKIIRALEPTIVITHTAHDTHPDHTAAAQVVLHAVQLAATSIQSEIYGSAYRVPILFAMEGYLPIVNPVYIDITAYKNFKQKLMNTYASQLSERLVQCVESSDTKNGVAIGTRAAEAFEIPPQWPAVVSELLRIL